MQHRRTKHSLDKQSESNNAGRNLLERTLALPEWIVREDKPDVHIDFNIELAENRNPEGRRFLVQLKSRQGLATASRTIRVRVKASHLWYYTHKCTLPVFVFLADLRNQRIFYLFVQEWAKSGGFSFDPDSEKTVSLQMPRTQCVGDTRLFREAVERAFEYMNELHPGTLRASARAEIARLEAIDDRFEYHLTVTKNGESTHTQIRPKQGEQIACSLIVKGKANVAAVKKYCEMGVPLKLPAGGFELQGSKLFEGKEGVTLEAGTTPIGDIELIFLQSLQSELPIIRLSAEVRRGARGFTTSAHLSDLVHLRISQRFGTGLRTELDSLDLQFDFTSWLGKAVLHLPYFEQVHRFTTAINGGMDIPYKMLWGGNLLLGGTFKANWSKEDGQFCHAFTCGLIAAIRAVCDFKGINPALPDLARLDEGEVEWWFTAAEAVLLTASQRPAEQVPWEFTITQNDTIKRRILENEGASGMFMVASDVAYKTVVGQLSLGRVERILGPATLSATLVSGDQASKVACYRCVVKPMKDATITTRFVAQE